MPAGVDPGLQIRCGVARAALGGFDSHTPPPACWRDYWVSWALHRVVRHPADSAWPAFWASKAACERKVVEIGFGNGDFLLALAQNDPKACFVGIELSATSVTKAARKALQRGLDNVVLVMGDARFMLKEAFPPGTFDEAYINFPCPWPKKRHAKYRLSHGDFPAAISSALKVKGALEMTTDSKPFAEEFAQAISATGAMAVDLFEKNPRRAVRTKYEDKWLAQGRDIYRLRFVKVDDFALPSESEGGFHMHRILSVKTSPTRAISGTSGGEGTHRYFFGGAFSGDDGTELLQVITVDDGFEQRFYLRFVPKPDGVLVKLDECSQAFRTPAAKAALAAIAG